MDNINQNRFHPFVCLGILRPYLPTVHALFLFFVFCPRVLVSSSVAIYSRSSTEESPSSQSLPLTAQSNHRRPRHRHRQDAVLRLQDRRGAPLCFLRVSPLSPRPHLSRELTPPASSANLHESCACHNSKIYNWRITTKACTLYASKNYEWGSASYNATSGRCVASGEGVAGDQWEDACREIAKSGFDCVDGRGHCTANPDDVRGSC
ncbi:uncharacterized protein LY79DRAFT_566171 [Colletotrichum navitas]|uniref:Uncharacterized protein n=1 Tax=Colletotrichum navitas TaxID=681940 RepID=A0AAD8V1I9_9PEZI|nr:uncharacterized protein LY79DRAFT_566171 [Colletotrichum navitas]KAK1574410.1 hypothetical protein LY79DRAFT_566171 [Colletotrichum navitas]